MRSRRDATRSLMPSRSVEPGETFNSVTPASRKRMTSPRESASRSAPSAVERTWRILFNAVRTRRLAKKISMVLASHTVQVTTEAAARPINTAFTTRSALRYIPHGLRSRGSVAVATTLSCANAGTGTTSHAINAAPRCIGATSHEANRASTRPLCLFRSSLILCRMTGSGPPTSTRLRSIGTDAFRAAVDCAADRRQHFVLLVRFERVRGLVSTGDKLVHQLPPVGNDPKRIVPLNGERDAVGD